MYTILTHLLIGWLLVLALTAPSVVPNSLPARVGKALAPALAQAQSETIYYVDATRPDDSGDGLSWENAKRTLQAALALAADGAQIWVADGIYYPDEGGSATANDRTATFSLKDGVAIYGGFAGSETRLSQRNPASNVAILSGEIQQDANADNNAYHVVTSDSNANTALLDGFTITGGNANGSSSLNQDRGGGIYTASSQAQFASLTLSGNTATLGGGVYNEAGSPSFSGRITISNNTAANGGGVYNNGGSPSFTNRVTISDNTASSSTAASYGGGVYNRRSTPRFTTNVAIINNTASYGGGVYNDSSRPSFSNNVSISNNTASVSGEGSLGGGVYNNNSDATFTNNVTISGNTATFGGGVFNFTGINPRFINVTISGNAAQDGGGVFNLITSNPTFINVVISGNAASNFGGGVVNQTGSSPSFINATISGNKAGNSGGGVYSSNSNNPTFHNSIIWGNNTQVANESTTPTYRYSLVQDVPAATLDASSSSSGNNIDSTDPLFIGPQPFTNAPTIAGNYRIPDTSPVRDRGDNAANSTATDRDGLLRVFNSIIDLGAYEQQPLVFITPTAANAPELTATAGGATLTPTPTATNTDTPTPTATANAPELTATAGGATLTPTPTASSTPTATPILPMRRALLPLVVQSAPPKPDLVISNFRLIPNKTSFVEGEPVLIEVTITNQGKAATSEGFWVDVSFNPSQAPRQNQLWQFTCGLTPCQGIVWGVTQSLDVGESVVLRSTPNLYAPKFTRWSGSLAVGTTEMYAYVDVWNPATDYGVVDEGPEGEQNNIRRITGLTVSGAQPNRASDAPVLPLRPHQP